jgi:hypothetical protein
LTFMVDLRGWSSGALDEKQCGSPHWLRLYNGSGAEARALMSKFRTCSGVHNNSVILHQAI